ncbi:MAG: hypothetical protein ACTSO9_13280 [Candidatus Helarchaeota archaeon]
MENILSKINIKNEPDNVQKGVAEILSFIKELVKSYNSEYSEKEKMNRAKLIERMEQAVKKFDHSGHFQPIADILPMLRIKIKKYIKAPKMFFEAKREKSIRLRSAERVVRSVLSEEEPLKNLQVCIDSMMDMPGDYGPAIEGVFYGELKDELDPDILTKHMYILSIFLKTLCSINSGEIRELLKKHKDYRSVADMVRHIIQETKNGIDHVLDSREKIIEYFFPEKTDIGTIKADLVAVLYEKKLLDDKTPGEVFLIAQKVIDKFNALASFLSVSLQALMGRKNMMTLQKEIEKIGISISTGTKITMLTNRLKNETTDKEYIHTLTEIEKHLDELVGKINNEITPIFAKSKIGEWIMEYQREVIEKGGINISELSRTASIDTIKHIERKKEILGQIEDDSTISYIKLKAQEVRSSAYTVDVILKAEKILSELEKDNGWMHEPTPNELPLYNASLGLLLNTIKELEKEKDILLIDLAKITKKSLSGATLVPIVPGIKNEDHPISPPVRRFISVLEKKIKEIEEDKIIIKNMALFSQKLTIANKNLPPKFMEDPKYLENPLTFKEHLEREKTKLIAQKDSMAIEEEEFKKRIDAFNYLEKMLDTLNNMYPEHRKKMAKIFWLKDIFEE